MISSFHQAFARISSDAVIINPNNTVFITLEISTLKLCHYCWIGVSKKIRPFKACYVNIHCMVSAALLE